MTTKARGQLGRFAIVTEWAVRQLPDDTTSVAVYVSLAMHVRDDKPIFPKQSTLAEMLGVSEPTVRRALARLEEVGLVVKAPRLVNGRKTGNEYVVMVCDGTRTDARSAERALTRGTERASVRVPRGRDRLIEDEHTNEQKTNNARLALRAPSIPEQVFDAWKEATGATGRVVFTPKRRRLIEARVREGYTLDELLDAARGWLESEWHCGVNDGGKVYNSLELLFRDGGRVEQFRDLARGVQAAGKAKRRAEVANDPAAASILRLREREGRA